MVEVWCDADDLLEVVQHEQRQLVLEVLDQDVQRRAGTVDRGANGGLFTSHVRKRLTAPRG